MNGGCSRFRRSNRIHERWGSQGRTIRWRSPAFVLRHVVDPEGTGCRHTSTSNDPIHSKPTFVVDEGSDSSLTYVSTDWERKTWVVSMETGSNRIATDTVHEHVRGRHHRPPRPSVPCRQTCRCEDMTTCAMVDDATARAFLARLRLVRGDGRPSRTSVRPSPPPCHHLCRPCLFIFVFSTCPTDTTTTRIERESINSCRAIPTRTSLRSTHDWEWR